MTLRNTRLGRWVRQHERLHALVHTTWCRFIGPFDTKRVASSGGATTGGTTSGTVSPPGTVASTNVLTGGILGTLLYGYGASWPRPLTAQSVNNAIAWGIANVPYNVAFIVANYIVDGNPVIVYSGTGTFGDPQLNNVAMVQSSVASVAALEAANPSETFSPTFTCTVTGVSSAVVTVPGPDLPSANYIALLTEDANGNPAALALIQRYASGQITYAAFTTAFNTVVYGT